MLLRAPAAHSNQSTATHRVSPSFPALTVARGCGWCRGIPPYLGHSPQIDANSALRRHHNALWRSEHIHAAITAPSAERIRRDVGPRRWRSAEFQASAGSRATPPGFGPRCPYRREAPGGLRSTPCRAARLSAPDLRPRGTLSERRAQWLLTGNAAHDSHSRCVPRNGRRARVVWRGWARTVARGGGRGE